MIWVTVAVGSLSKFNLPVLLYTRDRVAKQINSTAYIRIILKKVVIYKILPSWNKVHRKVLVTHHCFTPCVVLCHFLNLKILLWVTCAIFFFFQKFILRSKWRLKFPSENHGCRQCFFPAFIKMLFSFQISWWAIPLYFPRRLLFSLDMPHDFFIQGVNY